MRSLSVTFQVSLRESDDLRDVPGIAVIVDFHEVDEGLFEVVWHVKFPALNAA